LPSVRCHVRVEAPASAVWPVLRDVSSAQFDPLISASRRSKDGSIISEEMILPNSTPDVHGDTLVFTAYFKRIECDDELRRMRLDAFAAAGTYDLPRPIVGEDWFFDVLDDGDGCVVVASLASVPVHRIAAQTAALQSRLDGLKTFCERAEGGPAEPDDRHDG
jgi:hypothetical protein